MELKRVHDKLIIAFDERAIICFNPDELDINSLLKGKYVARVNQTLPNLNPYKNRAGKTVFTAIATKNL